MATDQDNFAKEPAFSDPRNRRWLVWLCVNRGAVSVGFMMYAGILAPVSQAWDMTAAEAGAVQTALNIGFSASLVASGWLSDRIGAKRVFLWSSMLTAFFGILLAFFARSYESGLVLFAIFGLFQGGTYTPSIMLVAQNVHASRRGLSIGMILAGASIGYACSIALGPTISAMWDYRYTFAVCGGAPTIGAVAAWLGTHRLANRTPRRLTSGSAENGSGSNRKTAGLLTLGYTAHCWELLGMWAWMPTFLLSAIAVQSPTGLPTQGLWIGVAIHLSGFLSSLTMGHTSDLLGRRAVLIGTGVLGAVCSFSIGWLDDLAPILLLLLAAIYGFAALGDSPVLSTAITETVAPHALGSALAIRSILGFGAGGLAPLAFGVLQDVSPPGFGWINGFTCLGIGGLLATTFAMMLPRKISPHGKE